MADYEVSLEFQEIICFVRVAMLRSFSKAGAVLRLPTSTVSRKIGNLEERLGHQVFLRSTRSVRLTEAGEIFFDHAVQILDMVKGAKEAVNDLSSGPSGLLKVSAGVEASMLFINPNLANFLKAFPSVCVSFDVTSRKVDVLGEGCDIALRIGKQSDSSLNCRKLGEFRYGFYAGREFLEQFGRPDSLMGLSEFPTLSFILDEGPVTWTVETLQAKGNVPNKVNQTIRIFPRLKANNHFAILSALEQNLGISFTPHFLVRDAIEAGRVERILPEVSSAAIPVYFILPPKRAVSRKVNAFVDFFGERISDALRN